MPHDLLIANLPNNIDSAGALRQFVVNLFYGWGYNAYREENKDRADDLLIRQEVSHWLGQVRAEMARQESDYRREYLPPPSHEKPFPDRAVVSKAQAYQRLGQSVEALEVAIRNAAVPEDDRTWRRHRNEGDTLKQLMEADLGIAEAAIQLLRDVYGTELDPAQPLAALERLKSMVAQRQMLLSLFRQQ